MRFTDFLQSPTKQKSRLPAVHKASIFDYLYLQLPNTNGPIFTLSSKRASHFYSVKAVGKHV